MTKLYLTLTGHAEQKTRSAEPRRLTSSSKTTTFSAYAHCHLARNFERGVDWCGEDRTSAQCRRTLRVGSDALMVCTPRGPDGPKVRHREGWSPMLNARARAHSQQYEYTTGERR